MKIYIVFIFTLFVFAVFQNPVEARLLPRFQGGAPVKKSVPSGVGISVRLRGDRKALLVSFSNLAKAKNVSYMLIYKTNGKDEGAGGSVNSSSSSATRELLFGTCSSGVCRYHTGITDMRLEVTTELTSGRKTMRRFRIRV